MFVADPELPAHIGVYSHEHGRTQKLVFDIEVAIATPDRDLLDDTCDYSTIVEAVRKVLDEGHITLVETVAHRAANAILAHTSVQEVTIRVGKPGAVRDARTVGVIVTSKRCLPTDNDDHEVGTLKAATQVYRDQSEAACGS